MNEIKIFTGNSNPGLVEKVSAYLGVPVGLAKVKKFSDGESWVDVGENVRGRDVYAVQSTGNPANDNLMELLILIDALKRASADEITAVIPYYGYARQDRKVAPRTPISAKLVADLIGAAGATRVLSMDLHAGQIQGFFNIPFDHLYALPALMRYLEEIQAHECVVVSPDAGGVERARAYAKRLNASLAIIDKRREQANVSQVMNVIGDVKGKMAVIVDDLIDTAGTLTQASAALIERGASKVYAVASHGVLSGPAIERIQNSNLEEVCVTNSLALHEDALRCEKIKVVCVADLLGEAIRRIHNEDSVSSLFM